MKNWRKTFRICLLGALTVVFLFSLFAADAGIPIISARHTALPIYQNRSLAAVIKIDKFSRDHRRLGFFSVTLLPVVIFNGVRIEVQQPNLMANFQKKIFSALKSTSAGDAFEIHDFQLFFPEEATPRLTAHRVRLVQKKSELMFLLEGVSVDGALPPEFSSPVASAKGKMARLYWTASGLGVPEEISSYSATRNQRIPIK